MRGKLSALMMTLLLLAGCGGQKIDEAEQLALDIRSRYLAMAGCTAEVEITADYGDRVFSCTLQLDHTAGGDTVLTVIEPGILRGVTARWRQDAGFLEFEDLILNTGPLSPGGASPVDCIPFLLEEIRGGFLTQWGLETEGERECVRFATGDPAGPPGEGTRCEFRFDRESFALLYGEMQVDGRTALRCAVRDFAWKDKEG